MIESKPIDNNDICQAVVNLDKENIIVSSIIENQSIINFIVNPPTLDDNINTKRDFKNNDNKLLRNILSMSSKFLRDTQ